MSYLSDLYDYLGETGQTLAGVVSSMRPAVGQLQQELALRPLVMTATINFDHTGTVASGETVLYPPAGALILDAKVWVVTPFDAGTTNRIWFQTGAARYVGAGLPFLFPLANAYDVNGGGFPGGAAVTGVTSIGADTPQFLPWLTDDNTAVYMDYVGTGTVATQGQALVYITYLSG